METVFANGAIRDWRNGSRAGNGMFAAPKYGYSYDRESKDASEKLFREQKGGQIGLYKMKIRRMVNSFNRGKVNLQGSQNLRVTLKSILPEDLGEVN